MAYSKDIERLARSLAGQKLETEYIKHYLMETYGLDGPAIEALLDRLGIPRHSHLTSSKTTTTPAKGADSKPRRTFS